MFLQTFLFIVDTKRFSLIKLIRKAVSGEMLRIWMWTFCEE